MQIKRLAVLPAATVLALGALAATVSSATASTPASGSLVLTESCAYTGSALAAGIGVVVGAPATASWSSSAGLTATLPVTGGDAQLDQFVGSAQLGGTLVFIDARTGRTAIFNQLAFDDFNGVFTGVPQGGSTAVPLLDPSGDLNVSANGATETFTASETDLDPAAATYLNQALNTSFFKAGTAVGALTLTFTPAS